MAVTSSARRAGQASGSSGLMVYRFGAPLYFANATLFLDDVERLVTQSPTLSAGSCWMLRRWLSDTTGAGVLRQAITLLKKQNITFGVTRADRSFRSWLERYDLMELIHPDDSTRPTATLLRRFASLPRSRTRSLTQARQINRMNEATDSMRCPSRLRLIDLPKGRTFHELDSTL